jgi:hypothetical protein
MNLRRAQLFLALIAGSGLVLGANAVAGSSGMSDPLRRIADISGPCDEAEHANDPECAGVFGTPEGPVAVPGGVDISGPCDEAEHANDPRCTGAAVGSSGPGPGSGDDDNSNSGPGSGDDNDDDNSNSGPGDGDGDNSGPSDDSGSGSSGSSGSGHGGSDD